MEITKQDLEWIVNTYPQVRQLGRVSKHIDAHIKCMSIVKGQHIHKPSCSCEFAAYANMASSMWEQNIERFRTELETLNKPVEEVKPRGRKKS
jgi:hypothetical protein